MKWFSPQCAYKIRGQTFSCNFYAVIAFSALTLSVWHLQEHPTCKKFSDEMLAWLSVFRKVQMICICSSWCHCHPIISCFIKIQIV